MGIRKSIYSATGSAYIIAAIQLGTTIVITRALTAKEIGAYTIALSIVMILQAIANWGMDIFIIQHQDLEKENLQSAMCIAWASTLISLGLLFATKAPLAAIYGDPAISTLLVIMSLRIFLHPFSVVPGALLSKELRHREITLASMANAVAQSAMTIALIALGVRATGLSIGYSFGFIVEFLIRWYYKPRDVFHAPAVRGITPAARFGFSATIISIINTLAYNAPNIIIGLLLGTGDVGRFSRAAALVSLIRRGVDNVMNIVGISAYSSIKAENKDVNESLRQGIILLTSITWPFLAIVIAASDQIITVLFGPAWLAVSPIAKILCASYMIFLLILPCSPFLMGTGKPELLLRREVIAQIFSILFITLGALYSLKAAAFGTVVASICNVAISAQLLISTGVSLKEIIPASMHNILVSLMVFLSSQLMVIMLANQRPVFQLTGSVLAGVLCWFLLIFLTKHPLANEFSKLASLLYRKGPLKE